MSEIHYFKVFFTMYDDVTARGGGRTRTGAMANSAAQWQHSAYTVHLQCSTVLRTRIFLPSHRVLRPR
jgi:hypothetical protein